MEEDIKDIKDIKEILELVKNELENQNKNTTAILDYEDLCSLKRLYSLYKTEKDLNNELQFRYQIEHTKYLDLKNNYIPKSKVREKIDIVESILNKYNFQRENDEDTDLSYEEAREYACKVEAWKELLEDGRE